MKTIVLISCVKSKRPQRSKARDLYTSDLFKKQLHYAESLSPDAIFILSAKYGLVALDEEIDPYELALKSLSQADRRKWAASVLERLAAYADLGGDTFVITASDAYANPLLPHLKHVELPLKGLRQGPRLHFLKAHEGGGNA